MQTYTKVGTRPRFGVKAGTYQQDPLQFFCNESQNYLGLPTPHAGLHNKKQLTPLTFGRRKTILGRPKSDNDPVKMDYLNPAAGLTMKSWGYNIHELNKMLHWEMTPSQVTRMFQGENVPQKKLDWVVLTLTKWLYSKKHTDRDIERIYWENGIYGDPRQLDMLRQGRIRHHGTQAILDISLSSAEKEPPSYIPNPNQDMLSALRSKVREVMPHLFMDDLISS